MNDLLAALLLGILEGLTEFLPISSTGHLLIAEHWLGRRSDLFNIAIQAGAILAITLVYRQRIWSLVSGLRDRASFDYSAKLAVAFVVTAAVGLPVRKLGWELPETVAPIAWALIVGGVAMLAIERFVERRASANPATPTTAPVADPTGAPDAGRSAAPAADHAAPSDLARVTWTIAIAVGLAQVLAGVFPGTSRSAAAIFVAMLLGLSRKPAAAEFAFLVGIPTMFAATGYALLETFSEGRAGTENWSALAVAFVAATVTGFATVRWLLRYISTHRFAPFAWYRIALGAALLLGLPAGG